MDSNRMPTINLHFVLFLLSFVDHLHSLTSSPVFTLPTSAAALTRCSKRVARPLLRSSSPRPSSFQHEPEWATPLCLRPTHVLTLQTLVAVLIISHLVFLNLTYPPPTLSSGI